MPISINRNAGKRTLERIQFRRRTLAERLEQIMDMAVKPTNLRSYHSVVRKFTDTLNWSDNLISIASLSRNGVSMFVSQTFFNLENRCLLVDYKWRCLQGGSVFLLRNVRI